MADRYLPIGLPSASAAYETLIDQCMCALPGGAWKSLLYVARRTWGFGKEADKISLTQFQRGIRRRDGTSLDCGTGLGRKAIVASLADLERRGFIHRTPAGHGAINVYGVIWPPPAVSQKETSVKKILPGSVKRIPEVVSKGNTQLSVQLSVLQPTDRNRKRRDSSLAAYQQAFEADFYPIYPRKRAKPQALKAFLKAASNGTTPAAIVAALKGQLPELLARDPLKIPYPATWLNQEPWNDPVEAPAEALPEYREHWAGGHAN